MRVWVYLGSLPKEFKISQILHHSFERKRKIKGKYAHNTYLLRYLKIVECVYNKKYIKYEQILEITPQA